MELLQNHRSRMTHNTHLEQILLQQYNNEKLEQLITFKTSNFDSIVSSTRHDHRANRHNNRDIECLI